MKKYVVLLQSDDINFEALQKNIDLVNMPKLEVKVTQEYANQIDSSVNYLMEVYEKHGGTSEVREGQIKKEGILKQYAHFINKSLQESGLVTMRQQTVTKALNDCLEELENVELNKNHSETFLLYLDYLLQNEGRYYKTYLMKVAEDFAKIHEKNRAEQESLNPPHAENMILKNIKQYFIGLYPSS